MTEEKNLFSHALVEKCQLHRCQITRPILKMHIMNVFKVILNHMARNAWAVNRTEPTVNRLLEVTVPALMLEPILY